MADKEVKIIITGEDKGLSKAAQNATKELSTLNDKLTTGVGKSLDQFQAKLGPAGALLGQFGVHASTLTTKTESAGAALTKFGGVAVVAAGLVGAGLVKMGDDFDNAFDKIRTQTGATGDSLKGLQGDFKATLAQVPSSMGETSDAIATLNQKLGLTGKPLQDLSVQFLNLSTLTKTDVKTNVEAATGAFNNFGVAAGDQGKELDTLFNVTQKTGIGFDTLTSSLATGGAQFRAAGLDFDQAASLIGLLAKNGLAANDVLPALGKSMATAAKDGKPAAQVFKETFDAIKNSPTDTAAAGIALDVFGAKAGPKFAALIREGKLSFDEFLGSVKGSGDTINGAAADTFDFSEKLGILRNKLEVAIEPAASSAFDNLTTVVGALGDAFAALPAPVTAAAGNFLLFGTAALGIVGAGSLVAGQLGKLIDVATKAGGALAEAGGAAAKLGPALATAGPYVAALAVAIGAVAIIMSSQGDIVNDAVAAYDKFTTAVNDTSQAIKSSFGDLEKSAVANDELQKSAVTLGQTTGDLLAVLGSDAPGAIGRYSDALHVAAGSSKEGQAAADVLQGALADIKWSEYIAGAVQLNAAVKTLGTDGIIAAATAAGSSEESIKALTTALAGGDINATILSQTGINLAGTLDGVRTAASAAGVSITGVGSAAAPVVLTEKELADAAKKAAEGFKAQQDAALSLIDTQLGYTRAVEDVGTALGDFQQAQVDATKAVTDHGAASTEASKAQQSLDGSSRSLEDAVSKVAASAAQAAKDQATMAGATFNTSDSVNAQIGALQALKGQFPELAGAIDAHIAKLEKIPHEKKTDVSVNLGNSSAELQAIIDKMAQIKDKTVHVNAVGNVNVHGADTTTTNAAGGVPGPLALVGEQGPELVALPAGSYVYTNAQSRAMSGIPSFAGGGTIEANWSAARQAALRPKLLADLDSALKTLAVAQAAGDPARVAMATDRVASIRAQLHTSGVWTPPNSVAPSFGPTTPGQYASYAGVKTSEPAFVAAPAGGSQYNSSYYQDYGGWQEQAAAAEWERGAADREKAARIAALPHYYDSGGSSGAGVHIENLTIYMAPGANGNDIVQELKKYQRQNGVVPITTLR